MTDEDVYLDPKFLRDEYQSSKSERRHKHKRRHHRKDEESVWDVWTVVPLSLAFSLIVLCGILIARKSFSLPFCSADKDFRECIPCPYNAVCSKGTAKCKNGFLLSGKVCVADTEAELKADRLANKIGNYIASQPNQFCNESIGIKYEQILSNFRNEQFFNEAMERLENTKYDVHVVNNLYVSYNPTLDTKCKAYRFAIQNKEYLILIAISLILIMVLLILIKQKLRTRRLIKESAEEIIEKLKEAKGKKKFASDFEPLENEKMYKHWEEIMNEVEDYEAIEIFDTDKGKAWRYSP